VTIRESNAGVDRAPELGCTTVIASFEASLREAPQDEELASPCPCS